MKKRKIAVVTGSRAEYGLLRGLMHLIKKDSSLELQTLVTGSHLSARFGQTFRDIQKDGFKIIAQIPLKEKGDNSLSVVKSVGSLTERFAGVLNRLHPDLLVVLGDRYEIFAAAQAAFLLKISIAHIAGGDSTEGAFDESLRHAISKMAQFHFVTHDEAARRLLQLGENPRHIYNFGSPALDEIKTMKRLSAHELEKELQFKFQDKNFLVTFHPATLEMKEPTQQLKELLAALDVFESKVGLIFTQSNADPKGQAFNKMIQAYAKKHPHAKVYASLGTHLYLNTLSHVDAVIGNSSSGIYEAPSFKIPTVNIGDRQKGRLFPESVISCPAQKNSIVSAIREALAKDCPRVVNPYGNGNASFRIYRKIKNMKAPKNLLMKHFYLHPVTPKPSNVFVIAEAGVNHNGSLKLAKELVDAAVDSGANAVKFQSFKTERLTVKGTEKAAYQKLSTGSDESQWEMIKKLELDEPSQKALWSYCQKRKIEFLSTPFDEESLNFLVRQIGIKKIKVASGEITNAPLLLKMARTGLPLIVSTGMTHLDDIEKALGVIAYGSLHSEAPKSQDLFQEAFDSEQGKEILRQKITLLHCTSEYPAPYQDANLLAMDTLFQRFNLPVGLSDHTAGIAVSIAAAARGACVIEKHLTLDQTMSGPDHQASLEPSELKELVTSLRHLELAWGHGQKIPASSELKNIPIVRKVLVAQKRIQKGERFTDSNLAAKRYKEGTSPIYYWDVLGKTAQKNYEPDEIVVCD